MFRVSCAIGPERCARRNVASHDDGKAMSDEKYRGVRNSKKRTGEKERDREVVHCVTNIPSRFQQFSGIEGPKPCRREDGVRKVSKYRDGCTDFFLYKILIVFLDSQFPEGR